MLYKFINEMLGMLAISYSFLKVLPLLRNFRCHTSIVLFLTRYYNHANATFLLNNKLMDFKALIKNLARL